ncbi:hypothetical protein AHAS_Ahas18G0208800 [Arachis hypogaea]
MMAMANLANTMAANATATLQAVQRLGQPAGTETVHPPTFRGSTNPTEADNWFQAIERALQAQHVSNNQFVEFAAYQLLKEAQHWWQGECHLL